MKRSVTVLLTIAITACSANDGVATPAQVPETTTTIPPTTTTTLPPVVECPGTGEFEEGGGIADIDGGGSDSDRLSRISWEDVDLCETFEFRFETAEGTPASTVPTIDIHHLASFQVVRVSIDVEATVVTDQLVETGLVDRLFVVRSLDGGMFVDLHLNEPAAVRASTASAPARLQVDLRPGLVPFEGRSTIGDNIVVVGPTSGASVAPVTPVTGYARTSGPNVTMIVTLDGTPVSETSTTAADYIDAWGEFIIDAALPFGEITVFVGEASAGDGSLIGVTFGLTVN